MIRVVNHNYFVGTQEQLKLFIGDIAMFRDTTQFHKRVTGVASTKYDTINDEVTIDYLNELFPKFSGVHRNSFVKTTVTICELQFVDSASTATPTSSPPGLCLAQINSWCRLYEIKPKSHVLYAGG